jgi:tripartite ATP-independent transporter DctM subunit
MEWWIVLIFFIGLFLLLLLLGTPVAFSFLISNLVIITVVSGFLVGGKQLVQSVYSALTNFSLTPIPLFVLMGELLFHSGIILATLNIFNRWFGKLPGRLSVLSVAGGTLFAALSGSSIANTSMLGSVLAPEMKNKGYHTSMRLGPIMGAGSLAMIIPPSAMIVLLGGIASISVGPLLLGGVVPGILLATFFLLYIIIACTIKPELAPAYTDENKEPFHFGNFILMVIKDILPLFIIIFCVIGFIFLGIATPTEAAAVGCVASIVVIAFKRKFSIEMMKQSLISTLKITGMIMLIVGTSVGFGQLLSFTGASRNLVEFIASFNLSILVLVIIFLLIVFFLGMFIEPISVMMIVTPLFVPILSALDVNLIWFGIMMLIFLDLGNLTPPVGMLLFVMKGVAPEVPIVDIYKSVIPFVILEITTVLLILFFPQIVLWLPSIGG